MGDGDAVADAKQAQESRQAALTLSPAEPDCREGSGASGYSRRYKIGTTVLYSFTLFATGMGLGGRGAALLSLAKQTGIVTTGSGSEEQDIDLSELTMVGWAMTAYAFGFMFGSVGSGYLLDAVAHWHRLLVAGGLLIALAEALLTAVSSAGLLVANFAFFGLAMSFGVVSASSAAPSWVWGDECGPSVHAINAAFGVGMGFAPFLVSLDLSANDDFHSAFGLVVILSGLIALGPLFLDSPRKPPEPEEEEGDAKTELAFFARPGVTWALFHLVFIFNITSELVFGVWVTAYAEVSGLIPKDDAPMIAATFYWSCKHRCVRHISRSLSGCISLLHRHVLPAADGRRLRLHLADQAHLRLRLPSALRWAGSHPAKRRGRRILGAAMDGRCGLRRRALAHLWLRLRDVCAAQHGAQRQDRGLHVVPHLGHRHRRAECGVGSLLRRSGGSLAAADAVSLCWRVRGPGGDEVLRAASPRHAGGAEATVARRGYSSASRAS